MQALVLVVPFAILNAFLNPQYFEPLSFVVALVATFAMLCVMFWFWHSVTSRWGRNALIRAKPIPPGSVAPRPGVHFSYTGRTWRVFGVALFIDISLLFMFLVSALFAGYPSGLQAILFALAALMAVTMPLVLALLRKRSFTIDDSGLRYSGRLKSNFDLHWQDITEIDFVEPPRFLQFMSTQPMPPVYAILSKGGSAIAVLSPQGEFGTGLGDAMERALLEQVALHGIRIGTRKGWRGLKRKKARPAYPEV